jgi:hypothetical protein
VRAQTPVHAETLVAEEDAKGRGCEARVALAAVCARLVRRLLPQEMDSVRTFGSLAEGIKCIAQV